MIKLIRAIQYAIVDRHTGLAVGLHATEAEAMLYVPRKPPYDHHPGYSIERVLVNIEHLPRPHDIGQLAMFPLTPALASYDPVNTPWRSA